MTDRVVGLTQDERRATRRPVAGWRARVERQVKLWSLRLRQRSSGKEGWAASAVVAETMCTLFRRWSSVAWCRLVEGWIGTAAAAAGTGSEIGW